MSRFMDPGRVTVESYTRPGHRYYVARNRGEYGRRYAVVTLFEGETLEPSAKGDGKFDIRRGDFIMDVVGEIFGDPDGYEDLRDARIAAARLGGVEEVMEE